MKFDAARASATFEKLGDPDFAGPTGEGRIADFVAGEFERMGWKVERREVEGSRSPQRVGPWIAWIGYGVLITVSFCMIVSGNFRSQLLAILMIFLAIRWPEALAGNWIRPGRRIRPVEKAPVVVASGDGESSSPRRVVFQAVLGGLDTGFLGTFRVNRFFFLSLLHLGLLLSAFFTFVSMSGYPVIFSRVMVVVTSVMIVFVWVIILCVLSWEYRQVAIDFRGAYNRSSEHWRSSWSSRGAGRATNTSSSSRSSSSAAAKDSITRAPARSSACSNRNGPGNIRSYYYYSVQAQRQARNFRFRRSNRRAVRSR